MSRIRTVIEKIDSMIAEMPIVDAIIEIWLKEIKELLTDKTVLFLEWGEADVQAVARQRIAYLEDVEKCEVKENPLTREQVERVLEVLEKQYDCNYGITWEHLAIAMDYIDLPNIIEARRKPLTRKEYEDLLNYIGAPDSDKKSNGGRIPDNVKYGSWLRRNDPVAFNAGFNDYRYTYEDEESVCGY